MSKQTEEIYRSVREQWVSLPFGVLIALLGLAGLSTGEDPSFPAAMVAAGVLWVARCWSCFRLELTDSQMVVRRVVQTTARIPFGEIVRIDTTVREPFVGGPRRCLRVTLRAGTVRPFPEINGSDRPDRRQERDDAIGRVRELLARALGA